MANVSDSRQRFYLLIGTDWMQCWFMQSIRYAHVLCLLKIVPLWNGDFTVLKQPTRWRKLAIVDNMQLDQELISKLIGAYDEDHPECNNRTI